MLGATDSVPRGQTLYFDIEMIKIYKYDPNVDVEENLTADDFFRKLDQNNDNWISKVTKGMSGCHADMVSFGYQSFSAVTSRLSLLNTTFQISVS